MQETFERYIAAAKILTEREWRLPLIRYHYRQIKSFAEFVGVNIDRNTYVTASNIYQTVKTPPVECDGCGGVSTATGLRWEKADRGEPITVSVSHTNKPPSLAYLTDELIMERWFKPWSDVCDVKFKLVSRGGDCRISFRPLPGSTLGMVYQPRGGEFMEQGGALVGDMIIDSDRLWTRAMEKATGCHEGGHVLGLGHINDRLALLYHFLSGIQTPQPLDIALALKSYPYEKPAIT